MIFRSLFIACIYTSSISFFHFRGYIGRLVVQIRSFITLNYYLRSHEIAWTKNILFLYRKIIFSIQLVINLNTLEGIYGFYWIEKENHDSMRKSGCARVVFISLSFMKKCRRSFRSVNNNSEPFQMGKWFISKLMFFDSQRKLNVTIKTTFESAREKHFFLRKTKLMLWLHSFLWFLKIWYFYRIEPHISRKESTLTLVHFFGKQLDIERVDYDW